MVEYLLMLFRTRFHRLVTVSGPMAIIFALSCRGSEITIPADLVQVGSISIDTPSFAIERGAQKVVSATVRDPNGTVISVPVVFRSSRDSVAEVLRGGRILARDTGVVSVTASALGITSDPIGVHVVWVGSAAVDTAMWTQPNAASPGSRVGDSIRVRVRNRANGVVPGARVRFSVMEGGGSVSPDTAVLTNVDGVASAGWTLGPWVGTNTVIAEVVNDLGDRLEWVTGNPVTFTINTYPALSVVEGDQQTGQVLSALPVAPVVKLVDSTGVARIGVPITFTAVGGGRVTTATVSTRADGTATPGTWTLGDISGEQTLTARVESAEIELTATATGTAVYHTATTVAGGGFASCSLADALASCWGSGALAGTSDTASRHAPTAVSGAVTFSAIAGSPSHFCGVANDQSIYCWGLNALVDTSGNTIHAQTPTRLASDIQWRAVSPGASHNCAIATADTPYCWGDNARGQLGDLTTTTRYVPAPVSGGFKFLTVAAGTGFTCGLTLEGTALCWGANQSGQLGDGTRVDRIDPTIVAGGLSFQSIGAGEAWACGLRVTGKAACWGAFTATGQVQLTPLTYNSAPTFTALSVGGGHACGLEGDGTAWCWGANNAGQLGDSTVAPRETPVKVVTDLKFSAINAGYLHTCGRTISGIIACWGRNAFGEIGDNVAAFRTQPRKIVVGVNP